MLHQPPCALHSREAGEREAAGSAVRRADPKDLAQVVGEVPLVGLAAAKEVDFGESTPAGVLDHDHEQCRGGTPPAVLGGASALVQAHTARHLETRDARDRRSSNRQLVEHQLLPCNTRATGGDELVEACEEVGAPAPLGTVQLPQRGERGVQRVRRSHPPHCALLPEASGGLPYRGAEASRALRQPVVELRRQRRPRGHVDDLATHRRGKRGQDRPPRGDALQVENPRAAPAEPVAERGHHLRLPAWDGQEVQMVGAQRPRAHEAIPRHRPASLLLEGQAADQRLSIHDEQEVRPGACRRLEPPRAQERRGEGGRVDETVPGVRESSEPPLRDHVEAVSMAQRLHLPSTLSEQVATATSTVARLVRARRASERG